MTFVASSRHSADLAGEFPSTFILPEKKKVTKVIFNRRCDTRASARRLTSPQCTGSAANSLRPETRAPLRPRWGRLAGMVTRLAPDEAGTNPIRPIVRLVEIPLDGGAVAIAAQLDRADSSACFGNLELVHDRRLVRNGYRAGASRPRVAAALKMNAAIERWMSEPLQAPRLAYWRKLATVLAQWPAAAGR